MCISCVHYDDILIRWKPFIVQCTYAYAALLPKSGCLPGRGTCFARLGCELGLNLPELATLFGQLTREGKIATLTGLVGSKTPARFLQPLAIAFPLPSKSSNACSRRETAPSGVTVTARSIS